MSQLVESEQTESANRPVASDRLKVLFVIGKLGEQGGAERFTLGLAANLPRGRVEPWVCVTRAATQGALDTLRTAGVPCVVLGRRTRWESHRMLGLLRLLHQQQFDVLHAHMFGSNLWGTVSGRLARVPVVLAHEHTWAYQGNRTRAWIDGNIIGTLATRFVAVSSADAKQMIEYEGVPADKVVVMPTAYVPRPAADGNIRAELGLDEDAPLIATAAVLRPQKAIEVLLDAFALVLQRAPAAHLVIAGDSVMRPDGTRDPLRQTLEARARELGMQAAVHFLGIRNDVDAILRAADVAALSSDFEGTPLFAFECMAHNAPLVATAVGGVPDVVEDGISGILVPRRDPGALADALSGLLADPVRRASLSAAAAESLRNFSIASRASQFADLYEELFSSARR
jgi:glycosyltransferase involved in cell wall biosynthesis